MKFAEQLKAINESVDRNKVRKAEKEKLKEANRDRLNKLKAKELMERVRLKAKAAAQRGERTLHVKELVIGKHTLAYSFLNQKNYYPETLDSYQLKGVWKYLYLEALADGFKVKVFYDYDDGGIKSWYTFSISW